MAISVLLANILEKKITLCTAKTQKSNSTFTNNNLPRGFLSGFLDL